MVGLVYFFGAYQVIFPYLIKIGQKYTFVSGITSREYLVDAQNRFLHRVRSTI